jgi:outer membrane protein TolC
MENLTKTRPQKNFVEAFPLKPVEIEIPGMFQPENHPVYKNASSMLKLAEAKKRNEVAKYFPSISLGAEYMLREPVSGNSMSGEDMISISVTAPLPLYFAIKETQKVKAADEGIQKAQQDLARARLGLETSWKGEHDMAVSLLEVYQRFTSEVLPKYLASYRAQLGSFSSATVSLIDVLDAYRDYLEASVREAAVYRDLQKSIAMLKYLEGKNEK